MCIASDAQAAPDKRDVRSRSSRQSMNCRCAPSNDSPDSLSSACCCPPSAALNRQPRRASRSSLLGRTAAPASVRSARAAPAGPHRSHRTIIPRVQPSTRDGPGIHTIIKNKISRSEFSDPNPVGHFSAQTHPPFLTCRPSRLLRPTEWKDDSRSWTKLHKTARIIRAVRSASLLVRSQLAPCPLKSPQL